MSARIKVNLLGNGITISDSLIKLVEKEFGPGIKETWDGSFVVPDIGVDQSIREKLSDIDNKYRISYDLEERFLRSHGKSALEMVRLRENRFNDIFSAVIYPDSSNVDTLMSDLNSRGVRAVVFGGGTTVTGGLLRGKNRDLVCIDTSLLNNVELGNGYVVCGPGVKGASLEAFLNAHGKTCGHFPESIATSTVGGWVSTKASGQESNLYGDIENLVISVKLSRSDFNISDKITPRESTGPSAAQIAMGGEGRTGLITQVTLRTFDLPENYTYASYMFPSFEKGIDYLSHLEKYPAVARLSDENETLFMMASVSESSKKEIFLRLMKLKGIDTSSSSLLIMMHPGKYRMAHPREGKSSGRSIALEWKKNRYGRPDVGDFLWKIGFIPDTLETSVFWKDAPSLYADAKSRFADSLERLGIKGILMAHVSHLYRQGPAIYFTLVIRTTNGESDLNEVRTALLETFRENGGSITHHHGIGSYFTGSLDSGKKALIRLLQDPVFSDEEN